MNISSIQSKIVKVEISGFFPKWLQKQSRSVRLIQHLVDHHVPFHNISHRPVINLAEFWVPSKRENSKTNTRQLAYSVSLKNATSVPRCRCGQGEPGGHLYSRHLQCTVGHCVSPQFGRSDPFRVDSTAVASGETAQMFAPLASTGYALALKQLIFPYQRQMT